MTNFTAIIIGLLFSSYGVILSLNFTNSLIRIFPNLSDIKNNKTDLKCKLLIYNDLLIIIISVICRLILRNSRISYNHFVNILFFIVIFSMITKLLIDLLYSNNKNNYLKRVHLLLSILVPLGSASIFIYLITSEMFWNSSVGWTLFISSLLGLIIIGFSCINRTPKIYEKNKYKYYIELIFGIWVVLLGFIYPVAVQHYNSSSISPVLSLLEVVILISTISYIFVSLKLKKPQELYHYTLLIGFVTPVILALNNKTYLVSSKIPISNFINPKNSTNFYYNLVFIITVFIIISIYTNLYILIKNLNNNKKIDLKASLNKIF